MGRTSRLVVQIPSEGGITVSGNPVRRRTPSHRDERTNELPSTSLKVAKVPHGMLSGSLVNSTPRFERSDLLDAVDEIVEVLDQYFMRDGGSFSPSCNADVEELISVLNKSLDAAVLQAIAPDCPLRVRLVNCEPLSCSIPVRKWRCLCR